MSEEIQPKSRTMKYLLIASFAVNLAVAAEHGTAYLVAKSGRLHADVQIDGLQIGGGTAQLAEREQQLAALAGAMPISAVTPPPAAKVSVPDRKPAVPK